jgi:hypothetical protein
MNDSDELKKFFVILIAYFVLYMALFNMDKIYAWYYNWRYGKQYNNFNFNFNKGMSVEKACEILGIKKDDLKKMSKAELKKAYWKKAQEVHPDHEGGSEDLFKDLGKAWNLMKEYGYAA